MSGLPSNEDVKQWDVLAWAWEQGPLISPPNLHHLLLYLCSHAFYSSDNREGARVGQVLSARSDYASIAYHLSIRDRSTVRRRLEALRTTGYLYKETSRSNRPDNRLVVCWGDDWDQMREHSRAGVKEMPECFQPRQKSIPEPRRLAIVRDISAGNK